MQYLKNILSLFTLVLISGILFAQSPNAINYQAVARDGSGNLLKNKSLTVRLTVFEGNGGNIKVYEETHATSTNDYGLFNLKIGQGAATFGSFANINWATNENHLQVEVDAGSGYVNLGKTQFVSVPYAMHATTVENDKVNDADADPNNEIQSLSLSGQTLTISGGNSVNLPGGGGGTITQVTAGTGLTGGGSSGAVTLNAQTSIALWNANKLMGKNISSTPPTSNQVLKWNGTNWAPATIAGGNGDITAVTAGTGITGGGTSGAVTLNAQTTTALWNANKIRGKAVSSTAPTVNQVLKWNGTNWAPATDATGSGDITAVIAGTGITGGGTTGAVTLNAQTTTALWNANKLMGKNISSTSPSSNQVLKWNGAIWSPAADVGINYVMGDGMSLVGSTLNSSWKKSGNNLYTTATGNIGIGLTTPIDKFQIVGTNSSSYIRITRPASGTTALDGIKLGYSSTVSAYLLNYENSNFNFGTNANINMTIKNTGDIGLGTTNPTSNLHIYALAGKNPFRVQIAGTTKLMLHSTGGLSIGSGLIAAPSNGLLVNGNVGINASSPVDRIHVNSISNTASSGIRFTRGQTGISSTDGLLLSYSSNGANYLWSYENSDILFGTNKLFRMMIQSDGDVGIGTSNPSYDLQLGANSAAKPTSSSWIVISDANLKKEVSTFDDGLDVVLKIRPIVFRYKDKMGLPTDKDGIGTMAQELKKIAPYMVTTFEYQEESAPAPGEKVTKSDKTETYYAVDYGAMDFVLINAVKELKEQLDIQQTLIVELKKQVEELMKTEKK